MRYKKFSFIAAEPEKLEKREAIKLAAIFLSVAILIIFIVGDNLYQANKTSSLTAAIGLSRSAGSVALNESALGSAPMSLISGDEASVSGVLLSSENFAVVQASLEGDQTNVFDFGEDDLLKIGNIKGELYTAKDEENNEIRGVISCRTNRQSYVEMEYFKSGEKIKKTAKGNYLGFNHVLIIPALDPDSVYRYTIKAVDVDGNRADSEQFVFYTGAANVSLVDILEGAAEKIFGWAMK